MLFAYHLLAHHMCYFIIITEIATSAPRGGNHMGQVGVVIADHMITSDYILFQFHADSNHVSWHSVESRFHDLWG